MNLKKIQYFVGKPCTVFTTPINRNFKEEGPESYPAQIIQYFVGIIDSIDETGIELTQVASGNKSYFFLPQVIGIAEEELLDPSDPVESKVIEQIKSKINETKDDSKFIDPTSMAELAKKAKLGSF